MLYEVITISDTTLIVYGNSSFVGRIDVSALWARCPWPIVITSYSIHYTKLYDSKKAVKYQNGADYAN